MEPNYAYLDKYGILHGVSTKSTAKEYAQNGKVAETNLPVKNGYFVVGKTEIVVYSLEEAYINGNRTDGTKVNLADYPAIYELYSTLM